MLVTVSFTGARHMHVYKAGSIESMGTVSASYRSINNWKTVEKTEFDGVPVEGLLHECGVRDTAPLRFIATDGYFWPAVGTTLTVADMSRKSPDGLRPVIALRMNGKALDPEPKGTGPLRYVAPQYGSDEVNKPSWVSNLRLIEVGPLDRGYRRPDAKKVPVDEVWVYGRVSKSYPVSPYIPFYLLAAGFIALGAALMSRKRASRAAGDGRKTAGMAVLVVAACFCLSAALAPAPCRAQAAFTFSLSELKTMPSFSGHYTFLKQLPPYTYYEADYTGVPLDYLLGQKLNLTAGASGVTVRARDGYTAQLSLAQARGTYPGSLKVIIAYAKGGHALTGDEGPLRLIVPQQHPGNHDQGGDPNTPLCGRMIYAVEVSPAAGAAAPSPGSVPSGSLAVYGSVTGPPTPQPTPQPQPQRQTGSQSQAAAQATATQPGQAQAQVDAARTIIDSRFGGRNGVAAWISGVSFAYVLPGRMGALLWSLYHKAGAL